MLGENAKAEQNFQRALALAPQDSEARQNWGWYLCTHERVKESIPEFERAVANPLYKTPEIPLINAGRCSAMIGDARAAEGFFQRALVVAPGNEPAAYGLAMLAYRAARYDDARRWMKAIRQTNLPPEALYLGMCVERKLGDRQAETSYTAQLRNRYPDSAEAKAPCDRKLRMTEQISNPTATPPSAPPRAASTAGGMLRAAREAMGMSLDTVAQQLKLAPRQVTALEEDDFAKLPGRTFVRGFMRNYARLVRIDAEKVLAALPGGDAPALDSPALQPTAPTIGHLPTMEHAKPGWTRWAIPLTLVAVIAAAAIYEFSRGRGDAQHAPATAPGAIEPERASPPKPTAGVSESPLPNPIGTAPAPRPSLAPESPPAQRQAEHPVRHLRPEHHHRPNLAPAT